MRRSIESVIESWATKDASRPLLIRGARRVGKTYAAEEIGRRIAGDAFVKLDFQTDLELIAPLFDSAYSVCTVPCIVQYSCLSERS